MALLSEGKKKSDLAHRAMIVKIYFRQKLDFDVVTKYYTGKSSKLEFG